MVVDRMKIDEVVDEQTKNDFIKDNIKLAHRNVSSFLNSCNLGYEELFSLSLFGLNKAIDTFDKSKKVQFSTYAFRIMRNEVGMVLRRKQLVTVPLDSHYTDSNRTANKYDSDFYDIIPAEEPNFYFEDFDALNILLQEYKRRDEHMYNIFFMYIGLDYTTRKIASELGVSQSYASRLSSRSVIKAKEIAVKMDLIDEVKMYRKIKARL